MKRLRRLCALGLIAAACACTSAGVDDVETPASDAGAPASEAPDAPSPAPVVPALPNAEPLSFDESVNLLTQGTFGPSLEEAAALEGGTASQWVRAQFEQPMTLHLPSVLEVLPGGLVTDPVTGGRSSFEDSAAVDAALGAAVFGEDQLRQRTAYALSQILVVSGVPSAILYRRPHVQAAYMDILVRNAFGNYRDLLEEVTYSPAMALYLTYFRNQKANPSKGSVPDENYAREIMQLFTIGVVELNMDGTPRLQNGQAIETYTNEDIVGLSRVFTGFSYDAGTFWHDVRTTPELAYEPLIIFPSFHSEAEKSFLGETIPAGTGGEESVDRALDTLFNHPNLAPFVSKQLIQRFVTSNPEPAYVERVARVFERGRYETPDGVILGDGRRGDLKATIAAILLDEAARDPALRADPAFGKLREPYLRFTHWARAFDVNEARITNQVLLWNAEKPDRLAQLPLRSPSVFNFYRPGYVAPGTQTAEQGLVAPELQILDATSLVGQNDVMAHYIFAAAGTRTGAANSDFISDYSTEIALAEDPVALVNHLDALLSGNKLEASTKERMASMIEAIEIGGATRESDLLGRAQLGIFLAMTAPEYLVQR